MRFGCIRGLAIAILTLASSVLPAEAGLFHHAIPRETPAMNLNTGQPYYAPPIPYGHYAKDTFGCIHGAAGMVHGMVGKLCSLCKSCGKCGGPGCGNCGGLGHHNNKSCGTCGGDGCRKCGGLFHHGGGGGGGGVVMNDPAIIDAGHTGGGLFHGNGNGSGNGHNHTGLCGPGMSCATPQTVFADTVIMPSSQSAVPCGACNGAGKGCGHCGGRGFFSKLKNCGLCGGHGRMGNGGLCGGCAGLGHGCNDPGCGGRGHSLCDGCGGRGCNKCKGCGLIHALLGKPRSILSGLMHRNDVEYFVGPGGPVPITPGYVNYVNPVRSPRDFFAFPPFSEVLP